MKLVVDVNDFKLCEAVIKKRIYSINRATYNKDKIKYLEFVKVLKDSEGKCCYCGVYLCKDSYVVDHFIPKSYFLKNQIMDKVNTDNLKICCSNCNMEKGSRIYDLQEAYELAEYSYLKTFYKNARFINPDDHNEKTRELLVKYKKTRNERLLKL